jgi:hypothetical protein
MRVVDSKVPAKDMMPLSETKAELPGQFNLKKNLLSGLIFKKEIRIPTIKFYKFLEANLTLVFFLGRTFFLHFLNFEHF